MDYFLLAFLSAAWPGKFRVGANSPNFMPTISSETDTGTERQTDELRQDGGAARPRLDHVLAARRLSGVGLLEQIPVDKRAFPGGAGHS